MGKRKFADAGKARTAYLNALTEADNGNYGPLVAFARKLIDSLACVKNNVLEANPGQRIYIFEPSQTPVDEAKMEVKTTMKQLIMTIIKNRQFAS